jgi:NADH-quinone oxidoreductase subunit A
MAPSGSFQLDQTSPAMAAILPVLLFILIAVAMSVVLLLPAKILGPRRTTPVKRMPYESGMDPIHDTHRRFDVRFHLVAIAFLVFDVELLFLYPWAVTSRPNLAAAPSLNMMAPVDQYNRPPFADKKAFGGLNEVVGKLVESRGLVFGEVMVFIGLLALGFLYAWRKGVFRWR